ncbi:benzoate/H(+) symporter BenE family transporter [Neptunomonas phycophila]|uniref:benzoate/H(+) symporter BenE family transporter n=1 Tax=Neptunomonas phycophila TaxID=1572645 RepID=UPI000948B6CC|nr:benzoate/H(+) symporter BenE family transporter [Neptunomonas phycophila]
MPTLIKDFSVSALVAGLLAVFVSYSGPLAIVFQAGNKAGIDHDMMTSWVWSISIGAGITSIVLSTVLRVPVVTAWSAPGTALLVGLFPDLSLNEMVAAYVTAAVIQLIIGVSGAFDYLVKLIPPGIAAGMMAGILFQFSLGAFLAIETTPVLTLGMLMSYVVARRWLTKYTLVCLLGAGIVLAIFSEGTSLSHVGLELAHPQWITPHWTIASVLSVALPIVLVSLSGQFLPGMAILQGAGYKVSAKPIITFTSLVSIPLAFTGGISTVVAAITAAICTGKDAHEDPSKRYVSGIFNGIFYLAGAVFAGTIVSLFTALPAAFIAVLAGLALLAPIANNLAGAMADAAHREVSLIAFIITASGLSVYGLSSAFWGVVISLACYWILNIKTIIKVDTE